MEDYNLSLVHKDPLLQHDVLLVFYLFSGKHQISMISKSLSQNLQ